MAQQHRSKLSFRPEIHFLLKNFSILRHHSDFHLKLVHFNPFFPLQFSTSTNTFSQFPPNIPQLSLSFFSQSILTLSIKCVHIRTQTAVSGMSRQILKIPHDCVGVHVGGKLKIKRVESQKKKLGDKNGCSRREKWTGYVHVVNEA